MLCEFSSVIRAKAIEERSFIGLGGLTRQSFFVGRGGVQHIISSFLQCDGYDKRIDQSKQWSSW